MRIVLDALELGAVKVEAGEQAAVQPVDVAAAAAVGRVVAGAGPEAVHGEGEGGDDLLVGLGPLPEDLRVALDQVAVDLVEVDHGLLDVAALLLEHLVAHADGVLEQAQPLARLALLLVVARRQLAAQHDHGQQQRVPHLRRARPQVRNVVHHVRRRRPLGVPRRDARPERVREHQLPPARVPLLAHI